MEINKIDGLEFLEEKHYYKFNGKYIPSVSSIIKPISSSIYGEIDKEILQKAADRGTAVHWAIELLNTTGAEIIENEFAGYFTAYKKFREEHKNLKVIASEIRTMHPTLWYAGTADEIYEDENGNYILTDTKTSVNIEKAILIPQLTGYREALQESQKINISKCFVLHLKNDGNYIFEEIQTDLSILLACIKINNFVQKNKNQFKYGGK